MLTINYSLTPDDLAELQARALGGPLRRILRIPVAALIGLTGLILLWQAFFFFPQQNWPANLMIAGLGLLFLWIGLDAPGLGWLSRQFSNPYAPQQVFFPRQ